MTQNLLYIRESYVTCAAIINVRNQGLTCFVIQPSLEGNNRSFFETWPTKCYTNVLYISTDMIYLFFCFEHPRYINVSFSETLSTVNFLVQERETLNPYFHSFFSNRELLKIGILYDRIH